MLFIKLFHLKILFILIFFKIYLEYGIIEYLLKKVKFNLAIEIKVYHENKLFFPVFNFIQLYSIE